MPSQKSDKASAPPLASSVRNAESSRGVGGGVVDGSIFATVSSGKGRFPQISRKSWLVNVYKGKGDALACGSYRGIRASGSG